MKQNRFKSVMAWSALGALIVFVLKQYFNIEIPDADFLIDSILGVLVIFGILNNPTNSNKF